MFTRYRVDTYLCCSHVSWVEQCRSKLDCGRVASRDVVSNFLGQLN